MILCYGEILADMIGKNENGRVTYERFAGGAPFNVACAAAKAGADSGFVGCVGDDLIGRFLIDFAAGQGLKYTDIRTLDAANTTLAFVQLDDKGERSFCFYRKNTADYRLPLDTLESIEKADTVHLGSLALSEAEGVRFADKLVEKVKAAGKILSFDVNYRDDIFPDAYVALRTYRKYIEAADIVKFSEDELELFTGEREVTDGLAVLARAGKLVCVTLGGEGCAYCLGDKRGATPSIPVEVVDTTGAGDAFYGALLSVLDGRNLSMLTEAELNRAFRFACVAGAVATTARGAIDSLPTKGQIERLI